MGRPRQHVPIFYGLHEETQQISEYFSIEEFYSSIRTERGYTYIRNLVLSILNKTRETLSYNGHILSFNKDELFTIHKKKRDARNSTINKRISYKWSNIYLVDVRDGINHGKLSNIKNILQRTSTSYSSVTRCLKSGKLLKNRYMLIHSKDKLISEETLLENTNIYRNRMGMSRLSELFRYQS